MVAHRGAGDIPIPVPEICCQYVSPNWIRLFRKMIWKASVSAFVS